MKRLILTIAVLTLTLGFLTLGLHVAYAAPSATEVLVTEVDWKSLERSGRTAHLWFLKSFPHTIALGHGTYPHQSQRIKYAIDCEDRTFALSQWIFTDGPNGTGQVVWANRVENLDFLKPSAGSMEAAAIHATCELKTGERIAGGAH